MVEILIRIPDYISSKLQADVNSPGEHPKAENHKVIANSARGSATLCLQIRENSRWMTSSLRTLRNL
jgi:hypothetical protein